MKASVIIPTKNPGEKFRVVLDAVLNQNTSFDYEVLVIDSGSTDGTIEYVSCLSDKRVQLHCIPPSEFGHGRTRNLGVSLTKGEYGVLITHDATPANEFWLTRLVEKADSDPEIAGVFGRHLAYPEANIYTKLELIEHFDNLKSFDIVYLSDIQRYQNDLGYKQLLHFFSDNNALIKRSIWEKISYPDVDFAEDQQWAKLIIEAGHKKAYAHEAIVYHSHDYKLKERLQRSFDEAYAFKRYFGYVLCPNLKAHLRSWLGLTINDYKKALKHNLLRTHALAVLERPLVNFMRITGHFFGGFGEKLPPYLRRKLSWDARFTK